VTLDLNNPEASIIYDINSEVAQSVIETEDAAPSEEELAARCEREAKEAAERQRAEREAAARRKEEAASMEAQAALIRKILLSIEMTPQEFIRLERQQRSRVLAGDHLAVLTERGARP
jgi:hypothetical protein